MRIENWGRGGGKKDAYSAVHGQMCELRRAEGQLCLRDAMSLRSDVRNNEEVIEGNRKDGENGRKKGKRQTGDKDGAGLEIILSVRAFDHDREVVLGAEKKSKHTGTSQARVGRAIRPYSQHRSDHHRILRLEVVRDAHGKQLHR